MEREEWEERQTEMQRDREFLDYNLPLAAKDRLKKEGEMMMMLMS